MLKENSYYIVEEDGITVGFEYTPLYTNYEASSPRKVPKGILVKTSEVSETTDFYDGMPVTTTDFKCLLSGFPRESSYGNSTLGWVSCSQMDESKLRELTEEEYDKLYRA